VADVHSHCGLAHHAGILLMLCERCEQECCSETEKAWKTIFQIVAMLVIVYLLATA